MKNRITTKPFCQQLIARRQGMAGIRVQQAGKRFGRDSGNLVGRKPRRNFTVDFPVGGTIFLRQHVLVEWSEYYQHVVAAFVQNLNYPLEGVPLKGLIKGDPFELSCTDRTSFRGLDF